MDPAMIPMMIFTVVVLAMIGGVILLLPVTRRLGQFLEYRMSEAGRLPADGDQERILKAIESLRDDVARLAERQDFTERLLERPQSREKPGE